MKKIILTSVALASVAYTIAYVALKTKKKNNIKTDTKNVDDISTETKEFDEYEDELNEETETENNNTNLDYISVEINAEYCPRMEDGEECKKVHASPLKFFEKKYFTSEAWIRTKDEVIDWDNNFQLLSKIENFMKNLSRDSLFEIDFVGYDFGTPTIMAHYDNDPKRSIIIRVSKYFNNVDITND